MEGRSQLGGRPGKKYSVFVVLTGVRSREVAMEANRAAQCKVSHKKAAVL